ncbi:MAG: hypothetical protein HQL70_04705 [Magnetococcales bacterium]|nr:hypothetical protein [Magnetococcales bacterium]
MESNNRRLASNSSIIQLIVIICAIFVTPMLIDSDYRFNYKFDPVHKKQLVDLKPEYIFVGSSMLISRMDLEHFNSLMDGESGYILGDVGALSSLWFLWLKNSLIAADIKPKRVFIFFRDAVLTSPANETKSLFMREKILKNSLPEEPVYDRVIGYHKGFTDYLEEWLLSLYPVQEDWHIRAKWVVDSMGYVFAMPGYLEHKWRTIFDRSSVSRSEIVEIMDGRKDLKRDMGEKIFAGNIRDRKKRVEWAAESARIFNFKERLPTSFLPEIIRLGKEAELDLVFVRIQSRPNEDGSVVDGDLLVNYVKELKEYVAESGYGFYDLTGDPNITWSMYNDGAHIAPKHMKSWTENFVVRLREHLH